MAADEVVDALQVADIVLAAGGEELVDDIAAGIAFRIECRIGAGLTHQDFGVDGV